MAPLENSNSSHNSEQTGAYDAIVVNDDVDRAYAQFRKIMMSGETDGDALPADILSEH